MSDPQPPVVILPLVDYERMKKQIADLRAALAVHAVGRRPLDMGPSFRGYSADHCALCNGDSGLAGTLRHSDDCPLAEDPT